MSSTAEDKPWDSWDMELPMSYQTKDYSGYSLFTDTKFQALMAAEVRAAALKRMTAALPAEAVMQGVALFQGGQSKLFEFYDSDTLIAPFRQEAFFRYLFLVEEPDCYAALELATGKSILFVPLMDDDAQRWNGPNRQLEWYKERYGIDEVYPATDVAKVLEDKAYTHVHTLKGENSDSGLTTKNTATLEKVGIAADVAAKMTVDDTKLYDVLCEARVYKTKRELELLTAGCLVSSQAHVYVMRHVKPGMREMHLEAMFKAWTNYYGGSRHCAYTCICACGPHGSILHYGHAGRPNDRELQPHDFALLDMGAEFCGYATDITRTYPVDGVFTAEQRQVYAAVRAAQQAVFDALKPGVQWTAMHELAERVILQHLIEMGVCVGGTVDEMMAVHMGSVFQPHGLGHLLGLYVHDVGGYPEGVERATTPGLAYLRCGRVLEEGMVLTVEPGLYFNMPWIEKAFTKPEQAKFMCRDVINKYAGMGGCRLEDDVYITATGMKNMTVIPVEIDEIERVMAQARVVPDGATVSLK